MIDKGKRRHCKRCEYIWYTRKDKGDPKACPRCKSYAWKTTNQEKEHGKKQS